MDICPLRKLKLICVSINLRIQRQYVCISNELRQITYVYIYVYEYIYTNICNRYTQALFNVNIRCLDVCLPARKTHRQQHTVYDICMFKKETHIILYIVYFLQHKYRQFIEDTEVPINGGTPKLMVYNG